jgi:uncharacterized protein (DUF885 family)
MTTPFEISDAHVERMVELVPTFATSIGDPRGADRWGDYGVAGSEAILDLARDTRAQMAEHVDHPDRDQRTAARVLIESLGRRIESIEAGDPLEDLGHLASSFRGLRTTFDTMDQKSQAGWDAIAGRLERLPEAFRQYASRLEAGRVAGRVVARRQAESVAGQARALEAEGSAYRRLADTAKRSGFGSARLDAAVETASRGAGEFAEYLEETYLPDSGERDAVGRETYERKAGQFLGMAVDAREAYEWGWGEFARLVDAMTRVADRIRPGATLDSMTEQLEEDRQLRSASPEAFCEVISARLEEAVERLDGSHFDVDPRIRPITVNIAPPGGALGAYYLRPSEDFSRPGSVWYAIGDQTEFPLYHQISTAYHEGFPGHHMQIGTAMANAGRLSRAHRLMVWYPGYGEGWAMYTERLMDELGFLERPEFEFGMLAKQLYRATRVVVDIGLHLELTVPETAPIGPGLPWSYDLAVEYMRRFGFRTEAQSHAEVLRYLGWAGQAISYKIGEREILSIRSDTERRLGPGFDLKRFHSEMIGNGAMGLEMLRTEMADRL